MRSCLTIFAALGCPLQSDPSATHTCNLALLLFDARRGARAGGVSLLGSFWGLSTANDKMVDVTVCNGNVVLPATWLVSYFGNTSPEAVPAGVRASITGETLWVSDVYRVLQFLKALPQVCGVIAHWARGFLKSRNPNPSRGY